MRVFLITGASIGVVGTIVGFMLGVVVCLNIESIRQFLSWLTNTELFSPELYFLSRLPAEMDSGETTAVVIMALVLSLLATLYPSWRPRASIRWRRCAMNKTSTAVRMEMVEHEQPQPRQKEDTPSFSCTTSNGNTGRATKPCACSMASNLHSGAGSRLRWSRPQAPESRHCSTSPVCLNIPIAATFTSTDSRLRFWPIISAPVYGAMRSALFISPITCCRNFPRSKNGAAANDPRTGAFWRLKAGRPNCLTISVGRTAQPSAVRAIRRRAQRVAIARAVANAPRILWRTSQPATSTFTPRSTSSTLCLNS